MIFNYWFDEVNTRGEIEKHEPLYIHSDHGGFITELVPGEFCSMNFAPIFTDVLRDKNIAAGETVQGWVFFGTAMTGTLKRMHIKDSTGAEFAEDVAGWHQPPMSVGASWPIQEAKVVIVSASPDIVSNILNPKILHIP
jgi:hypothetical protein